MKKVFQICAPSVISNDGATAIQPIATFESFEEAEKAFFETPVIPGYTTTAPFSEERYRMEMEQNKKAHKKYPAAVFVRGEWLAPASVQGSFINEAWVSE